MSRYKYGIVHEHGPAMEITTMIGCPLMCTFCPQDNLRESYGDAAKYMQLIDFKYFLQKLPLHTRIDFSGMAEPWANPNCTEMLEVALSMGFDIAVYTTLYGMKDPERVKDLLERYPSQVKTIVIHLPDANNNMRGWKKSDEWMDAAITISSVKLKVEMMTMDGSGDVHPDLKKYIAGNLPRFIGHTRADSLDINKVEGQLFIKAPRHNFSITCASSPFYDRNVLLPNGDVVLCCMDYNLTHVIGNLFKQNYDDIFNSRPLLDLITVNEKPEFSKCSICKSCDNVRQI